MKNENTSCFIDALLNSSRKHSKRPAIESLSRVYSHTELVELVEITATKFLSCFSNTRRVGFCMDVCPEFIILLLAVWKAGGVAILFDPGTPPYRLQKILDSTSPEFLFLEEGRLKDSSFDKKTTAQEFLNFDRSFSSVFFPNISLTDPAYLIFTSGSSGEPKGILVSQEGILPVIDFQRVVFQMQPDSRTLSFLSPGFDAFLSELGTTLLSGACYVIVDGIRKSSETLLSHLEVLNISHVFLPPALLTSFLGEKIPVNLKVVVTGGEVCPKPTVREWAKKVRLISAYGPTETTICSHLAVCNSEWDNPILGQILPNRKQRILFEKDNSYGELVLGGVGLAIGYWDNESETKESFIEIEGERWYKTGDLVRISEKGDLIFQGRKDRQWKIRGNRVEAGEIETVAGRFDRIGLVRAYLLEEDQVKHFLLAYIGEKEISYTEWRSFFAQFLPSYKIPDRFIFLENVITNANGKWDDERNLAGIRSKIRSRNLLDHSEDSISLLKNNLKKENYIFSSFEKKPEFRVRIDRLRKEVDFHPQKSPNDKAFPKSGRILVLGGTGYLGNFFVKEILNQADVLILSRQPFAKERIFKHPAFHGKEKSKRSFFFLHSDPSCPHFGLSDSDYSSISDVSIVYNLAGSTNAFLPRQKMMVPNLDIVKNCIQFALDYPPVQIHHISTLSVFLHSTWKGHDLDESIELEETDEILGGYAQSKWIAEELLKAYNEDYKIYRLGLLVGDSEFGFLNPKDFFAFFLNNYRLWKDRKTGLNMEMDFLPVDLAARLISHFSRNTEKIFHIHGKDSVTLGDMQGVFSSFFSLQKHKSSSHEQKYVDFLLQNLEKPEFRNHPFQLFLKTGRKFLSKTLSSQVQALFPPKEDLLAKIASNLF